MRITSKGQVTIPIYIREQAGLLPDTEVEFAFDGDALTLRPAAAGKPDRGDQVVQNLRGRGEIEMPTDQILRLLRGG